MSNTVALLFGIPAAILFLAWIVRDFWRGRAPLCSDFRSTRWVYAYRNVDPSLFWVFTLARAAMLGFIGYSIFERSM